MVAHLIQFCLIKNPTSTNGAAIMTDWKQPSTGQPRVFLLGISGPSSAGKTTLAHLLSSVFAPHVQNILHGDDFCKDISLLPTYNGYPDADGPGGVDFEKITATLSYARTNVGELPENFSSWQADVFHDQKGKALRIVSQDTMTQMRNKVSEQLKGAQYSIVIMEGFLLYHRSDVRTMLDGRLFVRLDHQEARRRRLTRPNYGAEAKKGEFWKTEDYFEKMVWRNYVEQHGDLFEDGNVEGSIDREVCRSRGIAVQDGTNVKVEPFLSWAVDTVIGMLKTHISE
jgi:nicotinamide/nicotinate riboside kinase